MQAASSMLYIIITPISEYTESILIPGALALVWLVAKPTITRRKGPQQCEIVEKLFKYIYIYINIYIYIKQEKVRTGEGNTRCSQDGIV